MISVEIKTFMRLDIFRQPDDGIHTTDFVANLQR